MRNIFLPRRFSTSLYSWVQQVNMASDIHSACVALAWTLCLKKEKNRRWIKEVELSWNLMAHGDARQGKWRGNMRVEWVASSLALYLGTRCIQHYYHYYRWWHTRLPVVDWTDHSVSLNGLVRFAERPNLVSAHVPSRFKRALQTISQHTHENIKPEVSLHARGLLWAFFHCTTLFGHCKKNFEDLKFVMVTSQSTGIILLETCLLIGR